jgi:hypothetical protein
MLRLRAGKRLVPIQSRRDKRVIFRYVSPRGGIGPRPAGVTWSTCQYSTRRPTPPAPPQRVQWPSERFRFTPGLGPHYPDYVTVSKPCFESPTVIGRERR